MSNKKKSITIITPTTGDPLVVDNINSVSEQTYDGQINHWIIVDGEEHCDKLFASKADNYANSHDNILFKFAVNVTPTGKDGFNGHRIYGGYSYFVNTDYVMFLDEDNWIDSDHIASFMSEANKKDIDWGYSLRKIVDEDGKFICVDSCESLGHVPTWMNSEDYLVDVGCYFLKKEIAIEVSPFWYRIARPPGQLEVDRQIARHLIKNKFKWFCTDEHTLNYRVGSRSDSVQGEFFLKGNKVIEQNKSKPKMLEIEI